MLQLPKQLEIPWSDETPAVHTTGNHSAQGGMNVLLQLVIFRRKEALQLRKHYTCTKHTVYQQQKLQ